MDFKKSKSFTTHHYLSEYSGENRTQDCCSICTHKKHPIPIAHNLCHKHTSTKSNCAIFFCFSPNYTNKSETVQDTINGRWRQEVCTCRSGIPSQPPPFCPPTGRLTAWATTRGDMPAQRGAHLPHSPSLSASKSKPIKAETQNSSPHLKMHKPCKREKGFCNRRFLNLGIAKLGLDFVTYSYILGSNVV